MSKAITTIKASNGVLEGTLGSVAPGAATVTNLSVSGATSTASLSVSGATSTASLSVSGDTSLNTISASPVFSFLTASSVIGIDADKKLVALSKTGTGSTIAFSTAPTFTGVLTAQTISASKITATNGTANAFTGDLTGNVTGNVTGNTSGSSGSCTGNAATATALATGRTIAMTGDVTYTSGSFNGSANVSGAATLATSGVVAGSYGSSTSIPSITVDTKGRVTAASTNTITIPSQMAGFRNRIINGDMRVWQRGTTFTAVPGGTYTADRFMYYTNNSLAGTITQSTDIPNAESKAYEFTGTSHSQFKYSLKLVPAVNGTDSFTGIRQVIEQQNIHDFVGNYSTLSFWVKSSQNQVRVDQFLGSGGFAGSDTTVTPGVWTKIKCLVFSSFVGPWTSASNSSGAILQVGFKTGAAYTTSDYIYLTGVQFELGKIDAVTDFEVRPYATELALCQRYYYRIGPYNGVSTTQSYALGQAFTESATSALVTIQPPVPMRAAPTALEQSGTAADYLIRTGGTSRVCNTVPAFASFTTESKLILTATTSVAGQVANAGGLFMTSSTNLSYLGWSAEL